MFTRCPECQTAFRITVAQLKARDGLVRCGRCSAIFRADLRLFAAADDEIEEIVAPPAPDIDVETNAPEDATSSTDESNVDIPIITDLSPFLPRRERLIHPLLWCAGILLTLLLLLGQFAYFYRNELAQLPHLETPLTRFCERLHCDIVSPAEYAVPELLETSIAPHPRFANSLRIRAAIVNRQTEPRPLPLMEIALTDSDGDLLARRVFTPREYLATAGPMPLMPPNVVVNTLLDITNPDNKASGYEIKLFPRDDSRGD